MSSFDNFVVKNREVWSN